MSTTSTMDSWKVKHVRYDINIGIPHEQEVPFENPELFQAAEFKHTLSLENANIQTCYFLLTWKRNEKNSYNAIDALVAEVTDQKDSTLFPSFLIHNLDMGQYEHSNPIQNNIENIIQTTDNNTDGIVVHSDKLLFPEMKIYATDEKQKKIDFEMSTGWFDSYQNHICLVFIHSVNTGINPQSFTGALTFDYTITAIPSNMHTFSYHPWPGSTYELNLQNKREFKNVSLKHPDGEIPREFFTEFLGPAYLNIARNQVRGTNRDVLLQWKNT